MPLSQVDTASPAPALPRPRGAERTGKALPWGALLAYGGLALLVAGGLWIALGAASLSSAPTDFIIDTASADEPSWIQGPLDGLLPALTDTGFGVALLLMLAGYVLVLVKWRALAPRIALPVLAGLAVAFALAPPLLSSDLFIYIGYGRLGVVHHINPYTWGPIAAPHDAILPMIYWQHSTDPYGPLFTLGSYALAAHSLPAQVWTYKALNGLAQLASLGLVWEAARRLERPPLLAALLLGANPLLLAYAVGGAHNDVFAMTFVLAAIVLLARRSPLAGGAALATAPAIKLTGGILLPFVLVGATPRRRIAVGAALAGASLVGMTLAVFGSHVLDALGPPLLDRLTGIAGGVLAGFGTLCALAFIVALWAARRDGEWLTAAGWATLALLCAVESFVPWYVLWVLPMAALSRSRALRAAVVVFTAAGVATHLPLFGFPES